MCEIVYNKEPKKKIANTNIVVYKHVCIMYKPPYNFLSWLDILLRRYDKIKKLVSNYDTDFIYEIGKVTKSWLDPFKYMKGPNGQPCYESRRGLYSYGHKTKGCNVKCIIPEGSSYYTVDRYDGTVFISDQLIIKKIIRKH